MSDNLAATPAKRVEVVAGVVQGPDPALPDLNPGIGNRHRHFGIGELHPGVRGEGDIVMVHVRGHLDVLTDQGLDVRIDVPHHVIVVLGVVEHVHVDHPAELARGRHVRLAREHLAPILRRAHDQGGIAMVPVADLFAVVIGVGLDFLAVRVRIEA